MKKKLLFSFLFIIMIVFTVTFSSTLSVSASGDCENLPVFKDDNGGGNTALDVGDEGEKVEAKGTDPFPDFEGDNGGGNTALNTENKDENN